MLLQFLQFLQGICDESCGLYQKSFQHLLRWLLFLFSRLLMWYYIFDLLMLSQPCNPGIRLQKVTYLISSWCICFWYTDFVCRYWEFLCLCSPRRLTHDLFFPRFYLTLVLGETCLLKLIFRRFLSFTFYGIVWGAFVANSLSFW